jgi:hypothetical protein
MKFQLHRLHLAWLFGIRLFVLDERGVPEVLAVQLYDSPRDMPNLKGIEVRNVLVPFTVGDDVFVFSRSKTPNNYCTVADCEGFFFDPDSLRLLKRVTESAR